MRFLRFTLALILAFGLLVGLSVLITLPPAQAASAAPTVTLQALIDAAPNGGTVNIAAGTYTESLIISKTLTLTGVASNTTLIKAVAGQRVISVTAGNNLRLENLTVTGGQALTGTDNGGGGVLVAGGNLTLVNCRIANNSAAYGGGVLQDGLAGHIDAINSVIELNTASHHGGAIYALGRVTLSNTQIASNTAAGSGGGVLAMNGVMLSGAQVVSNTADSGGGLIVFSGGSVLTNSLIAANSAGNGGGLLVLGSDLSAVNTQVLSNTASGDGGGLLTVDGNVTLSGGLIGGNLALNGSGGGLRQANEVAAATLTNMRFEQNTARVYGGGASISGTLVINHSTFATNTVNSGNITTTISAGGGVYVEGNSQILASTFVGNSALCASCTDRYGGGAALLAPATIDDSTFDGNAASIGGGVFSPMVTVNRSTFTRNTAKDGGAVYGISIQASGSNFLNNQALDSGGGLWGIVTTLADTRFISNTAGNSGGGGVWAGGKLDMLNTLLADNQASAAGAAIDAADTTLQHVTIAGTAARSMPAVRISGGYAFITDTIVSNYSIAISQTGGTLSADYNLFFTATPTQTGSVTVTWGAHNLNADPKFVNSAAGNYHLALGSPAIDSGTDVGVMSDLDGNSRPKGTGFDMGAYEFLSLYLPLIMRF